LPPRPPLLVAAATGLVFLALRRPRARAAAAFLWGILLLPWSAAPRGLELEVADVGHGTAALLRAPGLEALVFDAGSRDRRGLYPEALAPLLARWEVSRPLVVLSHPDQDHGAALGRLSERYPPRAFLGARPAQSAVRLPHDALELDLDSGRVLLPGMARELRIRVLRGSNLAGNEGSRSLEVLWCGERLLLCGDAEGPGLLCPWLAEGPTRLLLYPHHGSESPFLGPLLEATDPEEVWISSAARPPIAAELDRRGLPWRWTGRAGPLALRLP
jgi:beta-lactamase superfamily II metal-dependent hydrolase